MADEHKAGRKIGGLLAASIAAGVVLIAFGAMTLIAPFFQLSYAPTGSGRLAQARSTPAPAESDWPEPPQWGPEIPADLSAYSGTASRTG